VIGNTPLVTVLLPVFNCETYITEAINSILLQTFTDFELLIIEGGSKDRSIEIIEQFNDPRIKLIQQEKSTKGLAAALNQGLRLAKGKYIARMDCDDISYNERLAKQVKFMEDNPTIGVSGTWYEIIGVKNKEILRYPQKHEEIKAMLFFMTPLAHPTVIIRKSKLNEYNLEYDPNFIIGEDYDLWSRCSFNFKLANLPEILLKYRKHPDSLYMKHRDKNKNIFYPIYKRHFEHLGISIEREDYTIIRAILTLDLTNINVDIDFFKKANYWLHLIFETNNQKHVYFEPLFTEKIAEKWFWICYKCKKLGYQVYRTYKNSKLKNFSKIQLLLRLKFWFLSILFNINKENKSHKIKEEN
jgi:glycosyltransferase involved in cell wall biosynthesis